MSDVCTYVWWAVKAGIKLKFEITPEELVLCNAAADQFMYDWFVVDDEYWKLSSFELLSQLKEFVNIIHYKEPISKQPVFTKYFNQTMVSIKT